jgi:hypothetical protein
MSDTPQRLPTTKADLLAMAGELQIVVPEGATNATIGEMILAEIERRGTTTQELPTRPIPTDEAGRQIDQWGLPLSGPFRAAELEKLKKRDPRDHPEDWADAPSGDQE